MCRDSADDLIQTVVLFSCGSGFLSALQLSSSSSRSGSGASQCVLAAQDDVSSALLLAQRAVFTVSVWMLELNTRRSTTQRHSALPLSGEADGGAVQSRMCFGQRLFWRTQVLCV